VEDALPLGWSVSNLSDGGTFDTVTSKVKWGLFFDDSPRALTCSILPPTNATGTVTFATHGTDTTIVVLVVYLIVRQVEDQVVMPLVIGRAVHLHPVITIFAVLVGLSTWGILGGLLGVPVAAAINVTLHELYPEETREYSDKVVAVGRSTRRRPAMASGQPQAVGAAVTAGQIETGQTGQIGAARATELGPEPDVPDPDVPSGDPR